MSVQILRIPSTRCDLDLLHLLQVILIVKTVPQHVPEVPERSLQRIRGSLLLRLLESSGLAFAVLDMSVSNVLMKRAIAYRHSHNS